MPPDDRQARAQLSVFDRLLDDDPKNRHEVAQTRAQSVRLAKDALRRDLEWLLNTRSFPDETEEELEYIPSSVLAYGLPDFTADSPSAAQTRIRLERSLRRALELFEPRLSNVTVGAADPVKGDKGILRFVISGWFRMSPAPVEVSFATRLELARGQYRIDGD